MAIDMSVVMTLLAGLLSGFIWTVLYKYKSVDPSTIDWTEALSNVIYGEVIAVFLILTGVTLDYNTWATTFALYAGAIAVIHSIILTIKNQFMTKVSFYQRGTDGIYKKVTSKVTIAKLAMGAVIRKMDAGSRQFLVFDLPEAQQVSTLACVDAAEAANGGVGTYTYAIQVGAWVFLIENGELTGSVHYWYRFWTGSSTAVWKVITEACLEDIRKNPLAFKSYNDLY